MVYQALQLRTEVESWDKPSIIRFIEDIGVIGKQQQCDSALALLKEKRQKSNVDSLPLSVNKYILRNKIVIFRNS